MKTYFERSKVDPAEYYSCLSHRTLSNYSYRVNESSYFTDPFQFEVMCQRKHSESRPSNTISKKDCSTVTTPRSAKSSPVSSSSSMPIDVPKSPAFAGSKFGSSPTPKSLPPPPSHWISPKCHPSQPCHEMARHIKMLLQMV